MRTDRDLTYGYEEDVSAGRRESSPLGETFVPKRPDPTVWKAKPQYVMSRWSQIILFGVTCCLLVMSVVGTVFFAVTANEWTSPDSPSKPQGSVSPEGQDTQSVPTVTPPSISQGAFADGEKGDVLYGTSDEFQSISAGDFLGKQAAIAHIGSGELIAGVEEDTRIYPASMTKVMTLIVAVEYLKDEAALQQKITVSQAVFDAMYTAGSSGVGLSAGESLTVESMLYALMLQSDGIAATELAKYVAGSESAFVALMNAKAESMGLKDTHFMNPTGLHHDNHYSTCRDIATIMGYAMDMSLCRKILTEDSFDAACVRANGSSFEYHVYNNLLVIYFNKYKQLQPAKAGSLTILAGKTGYTPEAGYCLVTCAQGSDGEYYVCVTAGAESYENCIRSYQSLYSKYVN